MKTIIIDNLEVWPQDLGEMTWDEAQMEVLNLGPGWRLPTVEEFNEILWPNREKMPNINLYSNYWSSKEAQTYPGAWYFSFASRYVNNSDMHDGRLVRPVRDLTYDTIINQLLKDF